MRPDRRRAEVSGRVPARSGYALLVIMMGVTLLLISLTAALPNAYTEGRRELEEELVFRGNEYARAIMLFQRQFGRYPTTVKELLGTNNFRFLRREYKDPMSRTGKWRFILADSTGAVLNSKTLTPQQRQGQTPRPGGAPATPRIADAPEGEETERPASAFFDNQTKGASIVGVASTSRRKSLRVFNGRTRYDEWEFIGLATPGTAPAGVPPSGRQPGSGGAGPQSAPFGQPIPPLTDTPVPER